jgi:hypothetical protein
VNEEMANQQNDSDRIYYYACSLLGNVISLQQYIYDDIPSDEYNDRRVKNYEKDELSVWLLDEHYTDDGQEIIDGPALGTIFEITQSWADEVRLEGKNLGKVTCSDFVRDVFLCFAPIAWIMKLLGAFDELLQDLQDTEYRHRYLDHRYLVDDMTAWLASKLNSLDSVPHLSADQKLRIQSELIAQTGRLVLEWREAVNSLAHNKPPKNNTPRPSC